VTPHGDREARTFLHARANRVHDAARYSVFLLGRKDAQRLIPGPGCAHKGRKLARDDNEIAVAPDAAHRRPCPCGRRGLREANVLRAASSF